MNVKLFGLSRVLTVFVAASAIVTAACGSEDPTPTSAPAAQPTSAIAATSTTGTVQPTSTVTATKPAVQATATAPVKLSGNIEIDGSSTVFPISQAVAEEFRKVHNGVQVPVGVSGTGGGFKRFVAGETDISDASRKISASEVAIAKTNGIEYLELAIAFDGLSILVNPSNNFLSCITTAELKKIWDTGSTVKKWSDVNPAWPNGDLNLYGPGTDSGTFDYFTEVINGKAKQSRADFTASEDDNTLVQGIAGDGNALGYFGFAYYEQNQDKLKLVAVDAGKGCITPSKETIEDGTYSPLSRPLYIYVSQKALERPEVKAFVGFYLANAATLAAEVGYVALPSAMYADGVAKIQ